MPPLNVIEFKDILKEDEVRCYEKTLLDAVFVHVCEYWCPSKSDNLDSNLTLKYTAQKH